MRPARHSGNEFASRFVVHVSAHSVADRSGLGARHCPIARGAIVLLSDAAEERRLFRGGQCRSADEVYENIGSDVDFEKADREVTSRFAGYGLALAVLAALGAISLGANWP
jgi:hypothetical protein